MALEAGELTLVLEYGHNLKDQDWFGRQDPYCVITCGGQSVRSKTHTDGGKNPVWNQSFKFNVINENDIVIVCKDKDIGSADDMIGTGRVVLARARTTGQDRQQVPLMSKNGKQHGFLQVTLTFSKNSAINGGQAPPAYGHAPPAYGHAPPPYGHAPPSNYGAPSPYGYYAPPAASPYGHAPPPNPYGAPSPYGAPPLHGAPPPAAYGAPPQPYGAPPQPYGAPPQPYGAPPQPYGAPPSPYGAPPPHGAPQQAYGAPQQAYGAPQQAYGAPPPGGGGSGMYPPNPAAPTGQQYPPAGFPR